MAAVKTWISIILLVFLECKAAAADGEIFSPAVTFARLGFGFNVSSGQIGAMLMKPGFTKVRRRVDFVTTEYKLITSSKEAQRVLNIGGSLSLDLAFGPAGFSLSAAGSYLNDEADRRDYAELLFSSRIRNTEDHVLDPANNVVSDCPSLSDDQKGTHVITGITTGGHCIVSVRFWVSSSKRKEEIEAEAKAGLDVSKVSASIKGKFRRLTSMLLKKANVTVSTYCSTVMGLLPTNPEEAIDATQNFLEQHFRQNPGGVPLSMRLLPLTSIAKCNKVVERPPRNLRQKQFKTAILNKLSDVKFAYKELVRCTSKFPLQEKKHSDFVKSLYEIKKVLRQLMIKLDGKEKSSHNLKGDESDVADLENLYYQSLDRKKLNFDDTLWRDQITSQCKSLAAVWINDQPYNKTEVAQNGTTEGGAGAGAGNNLFKCRERNLMLDANFYERYRYGTSRLVANVGKRMLNSKSASNMNPYYAFLNPFSDYVIRLKRPAASISYINIESSHPYPRKYLNTFDTNLLGLEIYIGQSIDEKKVLSYVPNYQNLAKVLEYPSVEEKKIAPDIYKHFLKFGSILARPERKFFAGVAIRRELDVKEPFGTLIIRCAGTRLKWITGFQLYGTECVRKNERFE